MRWPIAVQGREVDEENVRWLSRWIAEHAHWSRRKLAGELCVLWDWRDGCGRPKDLAARSFLLKIEQRGWIALPPLREAYRKPRANIHLPAHVPPEEPLEACFGEVGPARLEVVKAGTEVSRRWAHYLSRHHYLGLRVVGQNIGYLASHLLGAAARRINGDWQEKYGQSLAWLETFVERGRFAGTCYKAATLAKASTHPGFPVARSARAGILPDHDPISPHPHPRPRHRPFDRFLSKTGLHRT